MMKCCTKCQAEQPLSEFYVDSAGRIKTQCKTCVKQARAAYRLEHADKVKQSKAEFHAKNRERLNAISSARYYANRDEALEKAAEYRAANADRVRESTRQWREANPERVKELKRIWAQQNPEAARESKRRSYYADIERSRAKARAKREKHKERISAYIKRWALANPDRRRATVRAYQTAKRKAKPAWANDFFIEEAYHLAVVRERTLGGKWHVDHIVPLRGKTVCGLHVEHNLQVLPGPENLSKSNRYWPDTVTYPNAVIGGSA